MGCCKIIATNTEKLMAEYLATVCNVMDHQMNKAHQKELFGLDGSEQIYENITDLQYLLLYLVVIERVKARDAASSDGESSVDTYRTTYKLECIENYFACKKIDVSSLLGIFDLDGGSNFGAGGSSKKEGINYMIVETDNIVE